MEPKKSLFKQIVEATSEGASEKETLKLLEELNQYRKKLPPFEATILK